MDKEERREWEAAEGMEKAERSACMERERVHEWVRIKMWTREARVVGEVAGAVGGRGGEGMHVGTRGIGGGVCVWRCWGKEGGGTVVARDQPASRSKEARKKCWDFFVSSVWL